MDYEGNAIVYCEGLFGVHNGKTAHGLVRRSRRYKVLSVVDSLLAGQDAGEALDGQRRDIPILASLQQAIDAAREAGEAPTHFVAGMATQGGVFRPQDKQAIRQALEQGLHVVSGLHDFLTEDSELMQLAAASGVSITDVRKPKPVQELHFFTNRISQAQSFRIAVLGTDSGLGKRTTAYALADAFNERGVKAEMVGTGQTAWLQGARYSICLDALINDFVSGEIEHAVWSAWKNEQPEIIFIEGQGSLLNPGYPGGFEILAAAKPHAIILQHAPGRNYYECFEDYPIHSLEHQIKVHELIAERPVIAVTTRPQWLTLEQEDAACEQIRQATGLPCMNVLRHGPEELMDVILKHMQKTPGA